MCDGGEKTRLEGVFNIAWPRRGRNHLVGGVARAEGACKKLGADEGEVVPHFENLCLPVQVVDRGHQQRASRYAQSRVLDCLEGADG